MRNDRPGAVRDMTPATPAAAARRRRRGALVAAAVVLTLAVAGFARFLVASARDGGPFAAVGPPMALLTGGDATCIFAHMRGGEQAGCRYRVAYAGSAAAWIGLKVVAASTFSAPLAPPEGGAGGTAAAPPFLRAAGAGPGLVLRISADQGAGTRPERFAAPAMVCHAGVAGGASAPGAQAAPCQGRGGVQWVRGQGLAAVRACGTTCVSRGGVGAVTNGWTDTFTIEGSLPAAVGAADEADGARVTLTVVAVQAAGNPLDGPRPVHGWGASSSAGSRVGAALGRASVGGVGSPAALARPFVAVSRLVIRPAAYAFGSTGVGGPGAAVVFTVTNTGTATSAQLAPRLGEDTTDFVIPPVADGCTEALRPRTSCRLTVRFAPVEAGLDGEGVALYTPLPNATRLTVGPSGGAPGAVVTVAITGAAVWGCTTFHSGAWSGCQLAGEGDLAHADLAHADLSGANLPAADLIAADLRHADLASADLVGASLAGADLSGADLSGADLRGARLPGGRLRGANLVSADLSGADLAGADLAGADLGAADLSGADLAGAIWAGATCPDFSHATRAGAPCTGALMP